MTRVDPLTVSPPSSPNWALAAPEGVATVGAVTIVSPVVEASPEALADRFDAAALADARVTRADADAPTPLWRAYVQRSALVGFPDRISMRAVPVGGNGAALVVYSASVYGYSDMGVNKARVARWVAAATDGLPTL